MDGRASEVKVTDEPANGSNQSDVSGSGRKGSSRGSAGRGKGKASAGRKNKLPTARERINQLERGGDQKAHGAEGGHRASLADLGKALNETFPSSVSPVDPFQRIPISTLGYQELCLQTYRQLISLDKSGAEDFSEAEFMLTMGHALVLRLLRVQRENSHFNIDISDYIASFPNNMMLPAPIAGALDTLGVCKYDTGVTGVPAIYVPSEYVSGKTRGYVPSHSLFGEDTEVDKGHSSFYPFGTYFRTLEKQYLEMKEDFMDVAEVGESKGDKKAKKAADKLDEDAFFLRAATYSFAEKVRMPHKHRVSALHSVIKEVKAGESLKRRTLFSVSMLADYQRFLTRYAKKYQLAPLPSDTKGSRVLAGYAIPMDGDAKTPATEFEARSNIELDVNEQQAVRLFRWRLDVTRDDNCIYSDYKDRHWLVGQGPPIVKTPGSWRLTPVANSLALAVTYVSHFCVNQP